MAHDMSTVEGQLARAAERGMRIVTVIATGQRGWVTQEMNYGFHLRVRLAGVRGAGAVVRVKADEISE